MKLKLLLVLLITFVGIHLNAIYEELLLRNVHVRYIDMLLKRDNDFRKNGRVYYPTKSNDHGEFSYVGKSPKKEPSYPFIYIDNSEITPKNVYIDGTDDQKLQFWEWESQMEKHLEWMKKNNIDANNIVDLHYCEGNAKNGRALFAIRKDDPKNCHWFYMILAHQKPC